jgi:hypothetical protein
MPHLTATDEEKEKLKGLGVQIQQNLSCNVEGNGLPCDMDRIEVVFHMKQYLEIHGFKVSDD